MSEQQAFFVKIRGRTLGPFDIPRIRQMIQQGQISRINPVSTDGHQWQKAGEFAQLFQADAVQSRVAESKTASVEQSATKTQSEGAGRAGGAPQVDAPGVAGVWYYNIGDRQEGPVSASIIRDLIRSGQLSARDHAWRDGMANWLTVAEIPELAMLSPARAAINLQTGQDTTSESQTSVDFRETKMIISYTSGWLSFIYIFTYVAAALNLMGACILVVLAFREYSSLEEARGLLARSLISVLTGAFLATTAYFLHQYCKSLIQFRRNELVGDLNQGLRWIGRYWMLCGICLIITLFLATLFMILAVAVPGSVPWPFL